MADSGDVLLLLESLYLHTNIMQNGKCSKNHTKERMFKTIQTQWELEQTQKNVSAGKGWKI